MRVKIAGIRHHKCDNCKRDFTAEDAPHMTIEISPRSGWSASTRSGLMGWRFVRMLAPISGSLDFCPGGHCIGEFFENLGDSAEYVR